MAFTKIMERGRPPMWTDPQAFEKSVDEYFETATIPTWTGLALHLGFSSRDGLSYYHKEKPDFLHPIKKALARIESNYEQNLFTRNPAGAIFALKNFGWKDKQEVDQKTEGKLEVTVKYAKRDNNTSGTSSESGQGNS